METKQSRRRFLVDCAKSGAACCALLAWNRSLAAKAVPQEKQEQKLKPIDFSKLSYCGIPCAQICELYKATLENNVEMKKVLHERQEMKKNFGLEFEPDKVFCHTCKPGNKPMKVGMAACVIRICAMANGMESCVQCKNLAGCDKEYWKKWPDLYAFDKKNQARYLAEPGAALREIKVVR